MREKIIHGWKGAQRHKLKRKIKLQSIRHCFCYCTLLIERFSSSQRLLLYSDCHYNCCVDLKNLGN